MSGSDISSILCTNCKDILIFEEGPFQSRCEKCNNIERVVRCKRPSCKFHKIICLSCALQKQDNEPKKNKKCQSQINIIARILICVVAILVLRLTIMTGAYYWNSSSERSDSENLIKIEKLRSEFPSQKNETWYHFLSVLEKKVPTVKSITFLHGKDRRTSDCLTNKLVSLYAFNKDIKTEDITFSAFDFENKDYGLALEHYHEIVQRFRVFVTDLTKISGNIARIFHSLCDDISSDIKPSLFIFTLRCDEKTKGLKPIEKAAKLLQGTWTDLPQNEIYALLSRIIRNVVEIVPEKNGTC